MVRPFPAATAAALSLLVVDAAPAQTYRDVGGTVAPGVVAVGGDGSGPLFTSANPGKVTLSASLGGFQPTPSYSWQSVGTVSASYALPAGAAVVVYDTGANPITIKLGTSGVSVTAGQADVVQPNAWMAFAVGSATSYAVVGNGGPSTVVVSGGSGLPAGGGGGGGGSGGSVAQGSPGSAANAWPVLESVSGSAVSSGNPLPVTFGTGAALPAFASTPTVNIGTAPSFAVTGTFWQATQPVSLASLPALPAGSNTVGAVVYPSADPCMANAHAWTPVSLTSATTWLAVTNAGSKKIYVCSILLVAGAGDNVAVMEGTGSTCAGGTPAGVIGGTTAANGVNVAANGGLAFGNGQMAIAATATGGDNLCLITSSAGPLSGVLVTVQQ